MYVRIRLFQTPCTTLHCVEHYCDWIWCSFKYNYRVVSFTFAEKAWCWRSNDLLPASCNSSFGYRSPDINLNMLRRGGESISVLLKADVHSHCSEGKSCATRYLNPKDSMPEKLANSVTVLSYWFAAVVTKFFHITDLI